MYICDNCGDTREELATYRYYDKVDGNSMMSGWVEEVEDSCSCGGTYTEAAICPLCGLYMPEDKQVCDNCVEEYSRDFELVSKYAQSTGEEEYLDFLVKFIGTERVISFLSERAKELYKLLPSLASRCKEYAEEYIDDFISFLKENK